MIRLRINLSWPHGATPNPCLSLYLSPHAAAASPCAHPATTAPPRRRQFMPSPPLSHAYNLRSRGRIAGPIKTCPETHVEMSGWQEISVQSLYIWGSMIAIIDKYYSFIYLLECGDWMDVATIFWCF